MGFRKEKRQRTPTFGGVEERPATHEIEFSGDENGDGWETEILEFGKYKGNTFRDMIIDRKRRSYLKYLVSWKGLQSDTRVLVKAALRGYKSMKKTQKPSVQATKRTKRATKSLPDINSSSSEEEKNEKQEEDNGYDEGDEDESQTSS